MNDHDLPTRQKYYGFPSMSGADFSEIAQILELPSAEAARRIAEKCIGAVGALGLPHGVSPTAPNVSISIGVATATPESLTDTPSSLVSRADKALYQAKVDPHAAGPAGALAVGYPHDSETADLFQWAAQGHRGATAQMSAGG